VGTIRTRIITNGYTGNGNISRTKFVSQAVTGPAGAAGDGATDLGYTAAPTNGTVTSSTGASATVSLADATNAGLMAPAQHTKLAGIETAADVTDATNVNAAGAVMESDTGTGSMSFVIDEDNMASDSATKVPTQQSVKAYADTKVPKATFPDSVTIACSDMTTPLTNTGNPKAYWVNPYGVTLTLTDIKATLATAGTGTSTVIDVNEGAAGGTTLMATDKITIEATETDSDDATTQPALTDTSIASKGRITIDVDSVGTGAAGLQVTLFFTRAV